jgi:hypothetical protein
VRSVCDAECLLAQVVALLSAGEMERYAGRRCHFSRIWAFSMKQLIWFALSMMLIAPAVAMAKHDHAYAGNGLADTTVMIIRHAEKPDSGPGLTPEGEALGLPIDDRFADKQTRDIADALRAKTHGNHVLISWHHEEIPKLIRDLGGDSAALIPGDKWPSDVFGWVVVLRYDHEGRLAGSQVIHEHLMPDDH